MLLRPKEARVRTFDAIVLDDPKDTAVDATRVRALFAATFGNPRYQPPVLPSTAVELIAIARSPDVTFPQVAALLEREPLLASQVLRLAQSPVYRRAEPVRSLEQAAGLLGLRTLADLFVQASVTARLFRAPTYEQAMSTLRDHSTATAIIARVLCRTTSFADDYAFLCGLLHDVGTAACIIVLANDFDGRKGDAVPLSVFWPVIREVHESISLRLAQLWELPADVRLVIGHHHSLLVAGAVHPLAAIVCVADSLAIEMGHSLETEFDRDSVARAMAALRLTDAQVAAARATAEKLLLR